MLPVISLLAVAALECLPGRAVSYDENHAFRVGSPQELCCTAGATRGIVLDCRSRSEGADVSASVSWSYAAQKAPQDDELRHILTALTGSAELIERPNIHTGSGADASVLLAARPDGKQNVLGAQIYEEGAVVIRFVVVSDGPAPSKEAENVLRLLVGSYEINR